MDPHQRHPGQSQHIVHNPGVEGQVLAVMGAQADHKLLAEEAMASGYGPSVSKIYITTILRNVAFTYWPLEQSEPRGQYPVKYS